ncbi:MAG: TetR family transcriptional regulator [Deltaproteobacteria bacterium]|nr:TetR family transcriptional regulator [Nannocystaceae bacterium]
MGQRARKHEDKLARREAILAVAAGALGRRQYASVTMAEIAEQCGLAKGTLYLYFDSKEELFLATLELELSAWFEHLATRMLAAGRMSARGFAELVARSLGEHETLADLLPLLHTVLEQNIRLEAALRFKLMLRDRVVAGGALVEQVVERMRDGDGVRVLLRTHALVVGLRQMADPPPQLRELLGREELAVLHIDFETELADTLTALVEGMQHPLPANHSPARART